MPCSSSCFVCEEHNANVPIELEPFQSIDLDYSSPKMASKLQNALPSHMKPAALSNGDGNTTVDQKHHGKSQSHMVSRRRFVRLLHVEAATDIPWLTYDSCFGICYPVTAWMLIPHHMSLLEAASQNFACSCEVLLFLNFFLEVLFIQEPEGVFKAIVLHNSPAHFIFTVYTPTFDK